ncbi:Mitochondrial zinc maintenance protein 1, mitochondrial [Teratosphaeriaceae sp. CCFEE 6253]|nr:Mitochondrial zinc maintenance protein 1, mitochondrial [Teratosphaeriaceae sp. CCFEE 6253]
MTRFLNPSEIATNRLAALATYRTLLRAINTSFAGDACMHPAARTLARQKFAANRGLESGSAAASTAVEEGQAAARIIREHVVQGQKVGEEKYKLRFTEHTQRLDNHTAGELRGTTKSFREIKEAQL